MQDEHAVLAATRNWVDQVVIGMNLCPFAKAPQTKGQVRYVFTAASDIDTLLVDLEHQLLALHAADATEVDTVLLVHPSVLQDFLDYNDFLTDADALLERLGLDGELQIASFHPQYCFADSEPSDVANYTNRSPYPMLHILREASVSRAVDTFPDTATIYTRNIETLRALGPEVLKGLLSSIRK